jgi:hypothetical protein
MTAKARLIAFYLPQFHPIAENDAWWGPGFTEWTNVTRAAPLFKGHVQPKLPAHLGFYDLRLPEVRQSQAQLAADHGVEGFCYWHYWLGNGKRLLERPFNEVLESGHPEFPFCLGWANHDWKGKGWMGGDRCLAEQTYPGRADASAHFDFLLRAFRDKRYIRIHDKPVLVIYRPQEIPNCKEYLEYWRMLASNSDLKGIHIIGDVLHTSTAELGLDGTLYSGHRSIPNTAWDKKPLLDRVLRRPALRKIPYAKAIMHFVKPGGYPNGDYPVIIPNWDTTPRLQRDAQIYYDYSPELFQKHVKQILDAVSHRSPSENLVFIRSWNEWAEGNYLEPDAEFGLSMLEALKEAMTDFNNQKTPGAAPTL